MENSSLITTKRSRRRCNVFLTRLAMQRRLMRRKIKLTWIENATARRASFKKRKAGLVKKMQELTTLCDVSGCLIIYGEGESDPAVVWPNEDEAKHLIRRFREMPEVDQARRMVNQEEYLRGQIQKMSEQLKKMKRKNDEMEASELMRQLDQGQALVSFSQEELAKVTWFLELRMGEIDRRLEFFEQPVPRGCLARLTLPPPTEDEISGREDFPSSWVLNPPPIYRNPHYHRFIPDSDSSPTYFLPRELVLRNNLEIQPYIPEIMSGDNAANHGAGRISGADEGYDGIYSGLEENLALGMMITSDKSDAEEDDAVKP